MRGTGTGWRERVAWVLFSAAAVLSGPEIREGTVGVVGFFRPLIEQFLASGLRVIVIEKQPDRVPADLPVDVQMQPSALATCDFVLCTASTLINDTLDEILASVHPNADIQLLGPSASGLPDVLFSRGVRSVGGVMIEDLARLKRAMQREESWGKSGRKYMLTPETYPGLDALLGRVAG